jgi:PIN domain nuclease of toxin-antitoxin system
VRLLLDSHVLLWALTAPDRLHSGARSVIADPTNDVRFSAINLWELAIGRAKGRVQFADDEMREGAQAQGFTEVVVTSRHGLAAAALPPIHHDPFDRMLVAQALLEELVLVTRDRLVHRYPVPLIRA